jgi:hypothetical protein
MEVPLQTPLVATCWQFNQASLRGGISGWSEAKLQTGHGLSWVDTVEYDAYCYAKLFLRRIAFKCRRYHRYTA